MSSDENKECPYVTGNVTQHCTVTPLTLTDAEREAIEASMIGCVNERTHATLRGLLERTK